jgi:hypothetical protein
MENHSLASALLKLDLMKNFLKAVSKDAGGFSYLKTKFPRISEVGGGGGGGGCYFHWPRN